MGLDHRGPATAPRERSLARRLRPTVRLRLTALYGGLFLLAGTTLLALTYVLVERATSGTQRVELPDGTVVQVSGDPETSPPPVEGQPTFTDSGRDGPRRAPNDDEIALVQDLTAQHRSNQLRELLAQSGLALTVMTALSVGLGWIVAGHVLQPLRTITTTVRGTSSMRLDHRLALSGPADELRDLGDTFDDLLDRLQAAFDAQRHFVANASHELRTPLTLSRALLQMTLTDPDATLDRFRSTCQELVVVGEAQERILESLLTLARSERGLDHREVFDLAIVTNGALATRQESLRSLRLDLVASVAASPVFGDIRLVERLVSNLLDNAARHNVEFGTIDVRTGTDTGRSYLQVVNTGPVVDPDDVDRLYEPFQRLDQTATASDGVGLGLAIVKAIIEAHDATLATIANPGGGLTVTVTFPQIEPPGPVRDHATAS